MDLGLEALKGASATDRDLYRPEFFRLRLTADQDRLHELLKRTPTLRVHDELPMQLTELVRSLNPSRKFTKSELTQAALDHIGPMPPDEYGVWVYYPWSQRLVHLLDEAEFVLVRTDRNRNKITREEQDRLGRLRIGVIGLSVGQSICLTLALERGFGELRIADFDTLDLSNLNRIRSGVHSLGHLKTVNVAREIAELDPFLKVTLFNQGLTRDNIDAFLSDGGALHVLVDECDSVDVKILCRQRAKAMRIPVIMDTSDRGMLDVERFDLEPDRPILHGLIDHLDPEDAAKAKTNEEKLPFVLPILGTDTLSKRMKASMLEIESSVTTWPQLASSVVLGGAVGTDVVRRIALRQFSASGRWFIDIDGIVADRDKGKSAEARTAPAIPAPLSIEDMIRSAEAVRTTATGQEPINEDVAFSLVEAACMAPSGGNSQPWNFLLHEGRLFVFKDPNRSFSTIDPGQVFATLAMGACLENLRLRAGELGIDVHVDQLPTSPESHLIAVIAQWGKAPTTPNHDPLASYIAMRCTNRRQGEGRSIEPADLDGLLEAVSGSVPEAVVQCITDNNKLAGIADLVGAAERVRMLNPVSHWDMFTREMRWTPREAETTGDGVDLRTLELSLVDRTGIGVAADPEAVALLHGWKAGHGFEKMSRKLVRASAGVALVRVPDHTPATVLAGGKAVQRLWLKATELGLAVHPISAPIFMGIHERFDRSGQYSASERAELAQIFSEFIQLFPASPAQPLFLLRLDHADPPSVRSLRRPVHQHFFRSQPITH